LALNLVFVDENAGVATNEGRAAHEPSCGGTSLSPPWSAIATGVSI
jgi:hypothetical protein